MPIPVTVIGSTGLTGSAALSALLSSPTAFSVTALTRRPASASTTPQASPETSYHNRVVDLAAVFGAENPTETVASKGGVYVSCLGTTRGAVGSVEAQKAIDLDLNTVLANKAKADGAETAILVSSNGANASSWFAYPKMKGQLEENIKNMGFASTVILRPGLLLYDGDRSEKRTAESLLVSFTKGARAFGLPVTGIAVDADDVGAAIAQVAAKPPAGVTTLYDADIVRLAKEFRAAQNAAAAA